MQKQESQSKNGRGVRHERIHSQKTFDYFDKAKMLNASRNSNNVEQF